MTVFATCLMALLSGTPPAASVAASPKPNYEISGQLTHTAPGTKIYLVDARSDRTIRLDSAAVTEAGRFRLRGYVAAPNIFGLRMSGQAQGTMVAVAPGSQLRVTGDAQKLMGTALVTGTADAEALARMLREQRSVMDRLDALAPRRGATQDTTAQRQIEREWAAAFVDFRSTAKRVAQRSGFTAPYAAFYFLSNDEGEAAFIDSATVRYARQWPKSADTKRLLQVLTAKRATAVGQVAPDITLPAPDSKSVSLSSLRGKYVLVDFWASWCGPCRAENPRLLATYQKFRGKNFEVYGVSIDQKDAWLAAVRQDNLPWTQVQDHYGESSSASAQYNVYAVPTSFLLDPQGRIVAKNLQGEELAKKLAELMP